MKKILLLAVFLLFSCTSDRYIQRDSEALSRTIYATSDSIDVGRIDLADKYAKQAKILVDHPPKEPIEIKGLPEKSSVKGSIPKNVIVVPAGLRGMQVIVVGSSEYNELIQIKENAQQLKKEYEDFLKESDEAFKELNEQRDNQTKLLKEFNDLKLEVKDKNLALLKRNITIVSLSALIGLYIFAKIRGLLPIPF